VQSTETIHAGLGRTRIGLNTHKSGVWRYSFNRLSDEIYTQSTVPKATDNYPITIEQTVLPRASAKFVTKGNGQRVMCVGESLDSNEASALPMEFSGRPPFSASIRVRHQGDPHGKIYHVQDIHSSKYELKLPHELQAPGDYEVEIQSVSDDAGCQSIRLGPEAMVKITALDIATIIPIDPSAEHCVGDQLEFTLSGVGPFTISKCVSFYATWEGDSGAPFAFVYINRKNKKMRITWWDLAITRKETI
jgi:nucleoporin POM152